MCKSKLLSVTDVSQIIKIIVLVDFFFTYISIDYCLKFCECIIGKMKESMNF